MKSPIKDPILPKESMILLLLLAKEGPTSASTPYFHENVGQIALREGPSWKCSSRATLELPNL